MELRPWFLGSINNLDAEFWSDSEQEYTKKKYLIKYKKLSVLTSFSDSL